MIEKMPDFLGTMDVEINNIIEQELAKYGITLLKSKAVTEFIGKDSFVNKIILDSEEVINADIVIMGTGVKPESEIVEDAGIELGIAGAIKVNRQMATNVPNICRW